MPWSTTISSNDVVAIHAALIPTENGDGEILLIGGDDHDLAGARAGQFDHTRRFNCRNPAQPLVYVASPSFDLFCCGHGFLGDGRLLVAGGTDEFPADAEGIHHNRHFDGHRHAIIYDPSSGAFATASDMNPEPGNGALGGGRWYPTLCTLSSGEVIAFQGHPRGDDTRHGNDTPERYSSLTNSWSLLPAIGDVSSDPILYSRIHLLRDGSVFVSSAIPGYSHNISFNPWTGDVAERNPLPDGAYSGFDRPSVLLPLVPSDGYRNRILLCGGTPSQFLDLGAASPNWANVPRSGSTAGLDRAHSGATLLPTGDVLLTGGTSGGNDQTAVFAPELYHTPLDHNTNVYTSGVGSWTTINEPATVLRNYHSTALLMPDGRVWTAGGNSPDQPGTPPTNNQKLIEIFDPPYPAGTRPTITGCPTFLGYGDNFIVNTPQASHIRSVVLMRCGSSTHAFNVDQRMVVLNFTLREGNQLAVTAPPDGGVAPPGSYMLFIVDDVGRPCSYARFVRIGGAFSMFTSRSGFSLHEIQALIGTGSSGVIANAFYVVLDGFCANDLASTGSRPFPPVASFTFANDNAVVSGVSAELASVLLESPSAPPNVTQRITLAYRLRWTGTHAFDGITAGDQRNVNIAVNWGPSQAHGVMYVFTHEHVYALKGPTNWLSIDVRVARVPRGQFLGAQRNNDALAFLNSVLSDFRGLPNDEFHPFVTELHTEQDASPSVLELSDQVDGVTVDNFAFAKVRFRAPLGISAANVKVFFRLFTTAVTNLEYDTGTIYPRNGNGAGAVALVGTVGGAVASIPFFASARIADPNTQPDANNVRSLDGAGSSEVVTYFGCWLDFNHDTTLRNLIRNRHQCLVAEIHFPTSPIQPHATPANDDQLSQRNLMIVESDNPGNAAAHTVAHTFELKPSTLAVPKEATWVRALLVDAKQSSRTRPDELFIDWHDLPRDSVASIFLPGADVRQLLAYAALRPGSGSIYAIDDHTLGFRIGDVSYLPIPGGRTTNLPGLLTIQLPPSVRTGSRYRVSVHQIEGIRRLIVGSFELLIPVSRSELLVKDAGRELGVLREIGASIPAGDRWKPVFDKYLSVLSDRFHGFGGVEGGPDTRPPGPGNGTIVQFTGKIVEILYDCFGDFEGFVLETCKSQHPFRAREQRLHERIREASERRLLVTIEAQVKTPARAISVVLHYS